MASDAPLVRPVEKAPRQKLVVAQDGEGNKKSASCDANNCDLGHEDSKWLTNQKSVDKYAKLASTGSGTVKEQALAHMMALQNSIQKDFNHVTSFAVAQEHAASVGPPLRS